MDIHNVAELIECDGCGVGWIRAPRKAYDAMETAYPNPIIEYINGLDMLGHISKLSADEVHPNIYGIQHTAYRMTARISKI